MKIAYLVHEKSSHSWKWIEYFAKDYDTAVLKLKRINGLKFLDVLANIYYVKKQITEIKPDILHAHSAGINGILAVSTGFHPFVLTALGSDILVAPKSFFVRFFVKFVLKKADLITCDAEHIKFAMIKLGADPKKIKIINFGVDANKFSIREKNNEIKDRYGLGNDPVVLSLRNLYPIYDIPTFIMAAQLVLNTLPNIKFLIISDGPEREKLEELVSSLNLKKNVIFGGSVLPNDMPKILNTADIYVSTSLSDAGISSATAEAMACGLPVVITDFGENSDWVKEGEAGFLFPPKNYKILAEKIIFLVRNKNKREEMGQAGRRVILERNDYYNEMAKMSDLYKEIKNR